MCIVPHYHVDDLILSLLTLAHIFSSYSRTDDFKIFLHFFPCVLFMTLMFEMDCFPAHSTVWTVDQRRDDSTIFSTHPSVCIVDDV